MTLGTYPALPLADARDEAKKLLARVALGEDPTAERKSAQEAPTFDELAREYLERYAKARKRSWREDERILRVYVPRAWRTLKAADITRRRVRDLLEGIAGRAPVMANRVRACLSRVYSFALGRDLVSVNPVYGVERPTVEQARERSFTDAELRAIWRAIEEEDEQTAAIFKLALLLGARGGELRGMRWVELDLGAYRFRYRPLSCFAGYETDRQGKRCFPAEAQRAARRSKTHSIGSPHGPA